MDGLETNKIQQCLDTLKQMAKDPSLLNKIEEADRIELLKNVGLLVRPERQALKQSRKKQAREARQKKKRLDRSLNEKTLIRANRTSIIYRAPDYQETLLGTTIGRLENCKRCYVCKDEFRDQHFFYDSMCPECGDFNYKKRYEMTDLRGYRALVTGARVKIGYQTALKLLRCGCEVIATTRFPAEALERYSEEKDFSDWSDRLHFFGLDLRHTPSVEAFAELMAQRFDTLDIIINNAAQTVRRPPGFYQHLIAAETKIPEHPSPLLKWYASFLNASQMPPGSTLGKAHLWLTHKNSKTVPGIVTPAQMSLIPYDYNDQDLKAFPEQARDADLQQVDLRPHNTWRMGLSEVSTAEMLEVHLINAVAPFVLCAKLKPLLLNSTNPAKHIVNASAMEGKFSRYTKTDKHPHTNMAKAALNMMSMTSAPDYAQDRIYMNAVDTGWVTDEDPYQHANRKTQELDFQPPLDIVDGAARLLDPIVTTTNGQPPMHGKFLKDYQTSSW